MAPESELLKEFAVTHHSTMMLFERRVDQLLRRERALTRVQVLRELSVTLGLDSDPSASPEMMVERIRLLTLS